MKYKFKPQTAIMVAGLLATCYADACYYSGTQAVCFTSGSVVDGICWADGLATPSKITATSDWLLFATPNLIYTGNGAGGAANGSPTGNASSHCTGPAQFKDYSGHTTSVTTWMDHSVFNGTCSIPGGNPVSINPIYLGGGTTSGGTCQ